MAKTAKAASGAIGKVAIIYGEVKAIAPDGTVRILGPNSLVFADDQIITGADGSVSLILDGTPPIHLDLGRMSQITLDEDVYGGPASAADAAAQAEQAQQAILAGEQPIEPEAPAAGGEASSGGGHPVVNNSLTGAEVTPDSGAETRGIGFAPLENVEYDTVPIGGDDIGAVDDEGINECWIRGNLGGPDDGSDHPTDFAYIMGNLSYNFGADGPHPTEPFAWSMVGLNEMGITSHGHTLLYEVVDGGTTLNAYYIIKCGYPNGGDQTIIDGPSTAFAEKISIQPMEIRVDVFSLELTDVDTGAYKFTLFKPLDHPIADTEDDINYIFRYEMKDGDNSTGSGVLRMTVDDDSPVMRCRDENRTVDEDDINTCLSDGNYQNDGAWHDGSFTGNPWYGHDHGPANIWGSLAGLVRFGADGPADNPWTCGPDGFSFSEDGLGSLPELTSKGGVLSYVIIGDTLFGYVPNICDNTNGNDGFEASVAVLKESPVDGRVVFTLELEGNGDYKFSLYDQLDHVEFEDGEPEGEDRSSDNCEGRDTTIPIDFSGVIVATDYDGDSVTLAERKFVINITDDEPKQTGCLPEIGIVEEEALQPDGNQEYKDGWFDPWLIAVPDTAVATGSLAGQVSVGADEPVKFSLSGDTCGLPQLTSNGEEVTYRMVCNTLYAEVKVEGDAVRPIFKLELANDGSYTFTLLGQLDHSSEHDFLLGDENIMALNLSSIIVATDFDGDSITLDNDFYIKVIDDVPDVWVGGPDDVKEDGAPICGKWDASIGADQPGSVEVWVGDHSYAIGVAIPIWVRGQNVGTLTVNENETWTFDPNPNLDNDFRTDFSFKIKAIDADSDNESDCQTIKVCDGTNPSGGGKITLGLDEEALDNANAHGTNPDSPLEQFSQTLSFTAGSDDLTSFSFSNYLNNLVRNTDGVSGNEITWKFDSATQITGHFGSADDAPVAITLTLEGPAGGVIPYGTSSNVTVTATLSDNLKHALANGEQTLNLGSVRVYAEDHDGDDVYGTVYLTVKDDIPVAVNDTAEVQVSSLDTNLLITLDVSGSMGWASGIAGKTRLDVAKDSINNLVAEYDNLGNVKVKIVTFSDSTNASEWMTVDQVAGYLSGLSPLNGTRYNIALDRAMSEFAEDGKITGAQNVAYFLSDGDPNSGYAIDPAQETTWETFLNGVDMKSYALGMGSATSDAALDPIAWDGMTETDMDGHVIANLADLNNYLIGTISPSTVSGNVLDNDFPGADGGSVTYATNIGGHAVDSDGETIVGKYGDLLIESDGDYTYTARGLAGDVVNVSVSVPDDSGAQLIINEGAYGIASNVDDGDGGRFDEINYLGNDKSEVMKFELNNGSGQAADGMYAAKATVEITEFYKGNESERGYYELYKDGVQVQGKTTFEADGKDGGNFTLTIDNCPAFDEIRFGALADTSAGEGDNSDYSIKSVAFELEAKDVFTYTLTDGDGDTAQAKLTIDIDLSTLVQPPEDIPS